MRITNGMMNNNQLYNINNNKTYMDQLNNQMSTQKKINNPSDDPIVAVRSLRLRSSLSEITQYYSKNVPDAVSWVETTGTAIDTAKDLLSSMKSQYTSGANDTNTVEDRETILDELKALSDQLYATGNSANEDRYLFTGYRTGVSLTFTEEDMTDRTSEAADTDHPFVYKGITEIFDIDDVESYSFMKRVVTDADITDLSSSTTDETTVDHVYDEVYRLRLAYDNIDTSSEGGTFSANFSGGASITITEVTDDADIPATDGKLDNPMAIYLNTSTGNLVFGSVIRSKTASEKLTITYDKSEWQVGDLKPEHYFKCTEKGKKNTS
ncbi:MAG: hypothetical protein K6F99_01295, partial [Lachnospiraceae bacterium]|nr:hypothetical protein [Lachnospiraceae bacterium]